MNELVWMQMFGQFSGAGSAVDVAVIVAFVTFGVLYFLVPVVGYRDERPVGMLTAMYLLAASVGVLVIQTIVNWSQILMESGGSSGFRRGPGAGGELMLHFTFTFALLKLCLFLIAMLAFISGLRSLRRTAPRQDSSPYGIGK
jgi:hypothetical protein